MPELREFKKNDKLHSRPMPSCKCEYTSGETGVGAYLLLKFGRPLKAGVYGAYEGNLSLRGYAAEAAELVRIIKNTFPDLGSYDPVDVRRN